MHPLIRPTGSDKVLHFPRKKTTELLFYGTGNGGKPLLLLEAMVGRALIGQF